MAGNKIKYICRNCGYETSGWLGKCPSCSQWNTFEEIVEAKGKKSRKAAELKLRKISEIEGDSSERIDTGITEMNRVLGGGLVKGSIVLVGGDPGIGKSTILLQLCKYTKTKNGIVYISGEESPGQIKMRAGRLGVDSDELLLAAETDLDTIIGSIGTTKPSIAIIDSIQTVYSSDIPSVPGSVSQIRNSALAFMETAKKHDISIFIVGHVTKDGSLAGPKILEHMVDTVLYFEGDKSDSFRILRAVKNRFGSTNEIGVFEMTNDGLKEVPNPSAMLLAGRNDEASGSCVFPALEGTRPVLVEIQALVSETHFSVPRRMSTGVDTGRATMIAGVMDKVVNLMMGNCDIYINAAGGIKITEPAGDLAIFCSTASSLRNIPVKNNMVIMGEVGLTGEVRAISNVEKRILEAEKMGFESAVVPSGNEKAARKAAGSIRIIAVSNVNRALAEVLGEDKRRY